MSANKESLGQQDESGAGPESIWDIGALDAKIRAHQLRRDLAIECLLVFVECEQDRYAPDMPGALARHAVAYADALLAELERPRG